MSYTVGASTAGMPQMTGSGSSSVVILSARACAISVKLGNGLTGFGSSTGPGSGEEAAGTAAFTTVAVGHHQTWDTIGTLKGQAQTHL